MLLNLWGAVGLTFTSFGRTGAHCSWQLAYFRLPCAGSRTYSPVQALNHYLKQKTPIKGDFCFNGGELRLKWQLRIL